jgi:glycosyltransferase involved in cell wall biosynthesis
VERVPNSIPLFQKAVTLNKEDYFPEAEVKGDILAAAGALSARKGFEFLIRAISVLHEESPNFTLIIFGEGELEFQLKSLVKELKLDKIVFFYGYKENLLDYFRWIDLFVMPSIEFEDMPITLLGACASGKASIGTKIAGIPEVIEDGRSGVLVDPGNVSELVDAIKRLVGDSSLRANFGRRAKELFDENHSFENFEIAYAKIYQECIGIPPVR